MAGSQPIAYIQDKVSPSVIFRQEPCLGVAVLTVLTVSSSKARAAPATSLRCPAQMQGIAGHAWAYTHVHTQAR